MTEYSEYVSRFHTSVGNYAMVYGLVTLILALATVVKNILSNIKKEHYTETMQDQDYLVVDEDTGETSVGKRSRTALICNYCSKAMLCVNNATKLSAHLAQACRQVPTGIRMAIMKTSKSELVKGKSVSVEIASGDQTSEDEEQPGNTHFPYLASSKQIHVSMYDLFHSLVIKHAYNMLKYLCLPCLINRSLEATEIQCGLLLDCCEAELVRHSV